MVMACLPQLRVEVWRVFNVIPSSLTLREVARRAGLSHSRVHRLYRYRLPEFAQVRFVPDFKEMNLLPLAVAVSRSVERAPPFTRSFRKAYAAGRRMWIAVAYVPTAYLDRYLAELPEPLFTVRGLEFEKWRPNPAVAYRYGYLLPVESKLLEGVGGRPVEWGVSRRSPDRIDVAIVTIKFFMDAYMRLVQIARLATRLDPSFPATYRQLLSVHYRRHVLPRLWRYNSITLYCDVRVNPVRAYYLVGRDAAVAARALIKLPMMYSALIDVDAAIVFGQPPPGYLAVIYQLLSQLDVEMPYGEIVLDPADITAWLNPYWAFTDGREWMWPEEARARIQLIRRGES